MPCTSFRRNCVPCILRRDSLSALKTPSWYQLFSLVNTRKPHGPDSTRSSTVAGAEHPASSTTPCSRRLPTSPKYTSNFLPQTLGIPGSISLATSDYRVCRSGAWRRR
ncbi:hypothetical protein C8R44DRAFT_973738 [Mycena epipterygia]|nr:hypothetical protein C8R44DRAFT_973738 [Mycena epipterygia]